MADTPSAPSGPPANLPTEGDSNKPSGSDASSNKPSSQTPSSNQEGVQTMADMIAEARRRQGPRPGALPSTSERTPKQQMPEQKKDATKQDETPKQDELERLRKEAMTSPMLSEMPSSGSTSRMVPIALILLAVIEIALAVGFGYLFLRGRNITTTASQEELLMLEDRLFAVEVTKEDVEANKARLDQLESTTETLATQEDVDTALSGLDAVVRRSSGDADQDGLTDYEEIVLIGTDPDDVDSDDDSFTDGQEVFGNYNPLGPGRPENYEEVLDFITQEWTGELSTPNLSEPVVVSMDLSDDGTLTGTWTFTIGQDEYSATLRGSYVHVQATDTFTADVTATITDPDGQVTTGDVALSGMVDRANGALDLTAVFADAFPLSNLAAERGDLTLLGEALASAVPAAEEQATDTTNLMESLPGDVATDTSSDTTETAPLIP